LKPDKNSPVLPAEYELADISAFQALERGDASPDMQQRALKWLIEMAGTYDLSYRPDSNTETTFAEGKRYVGMQVVKLLKINVNTLRSEENAKSTAKAKPKISRRGK